MLGVAWTTPVWLGVEFGVALPVTELPQAATNARQHRKKEGRDIVVNDEVSAARELPTARPRKYRRTWRGVSHQDSYDVAFIPLAGVTRTAATRRRRASSRTDATRAPPDLPAYLQRHAIHYERCPGTEDERGNVKEQNGSRGNSIVGVDRRPRIARLEEAAIFRRLRNISRIGESLCGNGQSSTHMLDTDADR